MIQQLKIILLLSILSFTIGQAQDYLHADGKHMKDADGAEVILRSIGTGNWMLQEGYMMLSSDVAPTQHEFRQKLIENIGTEKTDSFYNAWLAWHFTRTDVDSMKSWGFNAVRVAMHYKWFTPPIEDEPVSGEITWLDKGFVMIDSLLDWCGDNEMYLILDMHGAPGGQGADAAISDYDPSKPSLWESQENKDKLIALWAKLAERYSTEPWMGGYDLINEPNWEFNDPDDTPLWDLYIDITEAIREVDTNHMIIVEGNWFANDYSGVPSPWDDNLVFSFHKYWTYNTIGSIQYAIDLRNTYNLPIWLGESGENSNTWFTNLIALCEENQIGWSWWPVKKTGINNVLRVPVNEDYTQLIDSWKGEAPAMSEDDAFAAVMQFAENHKIENCIWQRDVVDAMIRQPDDFTAIPFTDHGPGEAIFFSDYDLGRNGVAYFDMDTANYHLDQNGNYTNWNQGHNYRNDGVDIEECQDAVLSNGFNVGWTSDGEWLSYTITADSAAAYILELRYAAGGGTGGKFRLLSDGVPITGIISLEATGGWQSWTTVSVEQVLLQAGTQQITFEIVQGGMNLNYFRFADPSSYEEVDFVAMTAATDKSGTNISLFLNKELTSDPAQVPLSDFSLLSDGESIPVTQIASAPGDARIVVITPGEKLRYGSTLLLSYSGSQLMHNAQALDVFTDLAVENRLPRRYNMRERIQAEDAYVNSGFELEACEDAGGGYNTAYANPGDYLDYLIYVDETQDYSIHFRVACNYASAQIYVELAPDGSDEFETLQTFTISGTGGWQNWQTQAAAQTLEAGYYTLRLRVKQGEFNLNWLEIMEYTPVQANRLSSTLHIYPNPSVHTAILVFPEPLRHAARLSLYSSSGSLVMVRDLEPDTSGTEIDTRNLKSGNYLLVIRAGEILFRENLLVY